MTLRSYVDHWPHAAGDTKLGTFPTASYINHWPEAGDFPVVPPTLKGYIDHFPQAGDLKVTY